MNIKPTDIVLEIGPGDRPHERADVLCEKYPFDGSHRNYQQAVIDVRPFVAADGMALPFFDNAFDYVICRQVIEHSVDPARFLREISRVGRAGYIETPSDISEDIFDWPVHLFKFRRENGGLIIVKKWEHEPLFSDLFHLVCKADPYFRKWLDARQGLFLMRMEWEGRIDYEIVINPADPKAKRPPEYLAQVMRYTEEDIRSTCVADLMGRRFTLCRIVRAVGRRLKRLVFGKPALGRRFPRSRLIEILACPVCRSKVRETDSGYACIACGRDFPNVGGLPTFLLEEA